ncbi:PREDICTED: uncharacterized protein LOC105971484 [Erythranthe guttata]|uniref:uncharacterized protein LOC105971484 n=1 Tax=Erythranthe guttata TaxID=4155 RepID=UPI00064DD5D0|nr:PREDICTED: uncharacterized protein LOC105971484 [Erythranthe guttata]|eukprot:XP_012851792.1 PREDICTED: uncharacterized protein LOC105971484 [Erythranthe guttata]
MKTATSDSSSVGLVTRSMAKKLKASSKTSSTPQTVQKGLPPPVNTSVDVEDSKREISQPMPHSTPSYSEMASVMTTNATTMEETSSKTSSTPRTVQKGLPLLVNTSADVEGSKREMSQPMPHSTSSYSEMASVMTTNATTMEEASSKTSSTPRTVQKGLPPLVNTSADVEGSKREMSQPMPHSTSSYSEMASVMTTNATTMEEQIASLTKAIEGLTKHVQQRDSQIAKLIEKMNKADASQIVEQIEAQNEVEAFTKQQQVEKEKAPAQELQVSPEGLIHVDQVMTLISRTIKDKLEGSSKSPSTYVKPYTQRIDDLKMPMGYIPPKFQQFDGKGNPKQHVAHFVETCNDVGTYGDHLVKQFVRSLKDNAFDWYIDLGANSIDSWKHLEEEFLNRFYSTRRTVSMIELTNSRQWKKEPVIDYITRWRNLSLNCKDRLPET